VDPDGVRLLLVDDDKDLTTTLDMLLITQGYRVTVANDPSSAMSAADGNAVDLLVLDVGSGRDDGRKVLAQIRQLGDLPVILISGRGSTGDVVLGLRLGADDYLRKPMDPIELEARITELSEDAGPGPVAHPEEGRSIDERTRDLYVDGVPIDLTAKEFDLLAFLRRHLRQVFTRGQLLEHVWSPQPDWQGEATVTEHVRRVRRKVECDPKHPKWVITVAGVGYRFVP
jgi:two-component system, OmpR family, phosphate regulon response regulator PhoB